MKKGLSVVILAYREEENLRVLIPQIKEVVDDLNTEYEIVIIDTAEPLDNTQEVCREYGCRYVNQRYPKFAGAYKTGIEEAIYDKFLIMDADGSHQPKYISDMYRLYVEENCDVTIGSRYVKGGVTNDAFTSIVMSRILNLVFRIAIGISAHDISTDFRIYNTELLKSINLVDENFDVVQEILLKMKLNNGNRLKIRETPITFEKRMYGESKRDLIPFIIGYIRSLFMLTFLRFSSLKHLVLYGFIGLGGACIDFLVFRGAVLCSIIPELSNVLGAVCGFIFTFLMNTFLNFRKTDKLIRRFVSYGTICLCGMGFSTLMMYLLKDSFNIFGLKIGLIGVVSFCQFLLNKNITYRNSGGRRA